MSTKHPDAGKGLFRREAVEYQASRHLGEPSTPWVTRRAALALAGSLVFLLCTGSVIATFDYEAQQRITCHVAGPDRLRCTMSALDFRKVAPGLRSAATRVGIDARDLLREYPAAGVTDIEFEIRRSDARQIGVALAVAGQETILTVPGGTRMLLDDFSVRR